jgi:predicted membrane-bound spermidine synthase
VRQAGSEAAAGHLDPRLLAVVERRLLRLFANGTLLVERLLGCRWRCILVFFSCFSQHTRYVLTAVKVVADEHTQAFHKRRTRVRHHNPTDGSLYAANTAGAIAGALLTPFVLLPLLGVSGAALAASAINLAGALGVLGLDRAVRPRPIAPRLLEPIRISAPARVALVLYTLAGGIVLGYEVIWSQAIVQFMSTRAFAFSVVLATYLAGLVVGKCVIREPGRSGRRYLGDIWPLDCCRRACRPPPDRCTGRLAV